MREYLSNALNTWHESRTLNPKNQNAGPKYFVNANRTMSGVHGPDKTSKYGQALYGSCEDAHYGEREGSSW
jgi:hypothetical protein